MYEGVLITIKTNSSRLQKKLKTQNNMAFKGTNNRFHFVYLKSLNK